MGHTQNLTFVSKNVNEMSKFHYRSTIGGNVWISLLCGTVNAIATLSLLFERSSHMSGRATDLGVGIIASFIAPDAASKSAFSQETIIIAIITASFVCGAVLGTRLMRTIGFGGTMMVEGIPLAIAGIMVLFALPAGAENVFSLERTLWAFLLAFPMGMQNASSSLTAMGRSTHVTGTLTDLGIAIASKNTRSTIRLFCHWGGFMAGGSIGFWMFINIPSAATQLLICAAYAVITGVFFAHPAVKQRLGFLISEPVTVPVMSASPTSTT